MADASSPALLLPSRPMRETIHIPLIALCRPRVCISWPLTLREMYGRVEGFEPPLNRPSLQIVYGLVLPSHGSPLTRIRVMCWQHGAKISKQASICGEHS